MRSTIFALLLVVGGSYAFAATGESIDDRATHQQSGVIELADTGSKINAFCLDAKGHIVAVCGNGPGEVRIANDKGEILKSWDIDVKPEAINVADDGTILVGGEGKLYRYDSDGKELMTVESPHAESLRSDNEALRKAAIAYLNRSNSTSSLESRIRSYEMIIEQLEKRGEKSELNASEERMLESLPKTLERYKSQLADQKKEKGEEEKGPSEEAIQKQIDVMVRSKMKISSITSSGEHVFIATRAIEGYGYDVWKTSADFTEGKIIVTGLRGCCGQMDVQCCKAGIFVAENSRDRVVHYDVNGKEITHWGKSDRKGIDGFGSCCNPMNVCFDKEGFVYTAEASLGRIKRFDTEGNLVSFVGDVDLVPGCKNVSIAVSPVNDKIYMLDLTRNHIKVMQPKEDQPTKEPAAKESAEKAKPKESILSALLGGGSK